MSDACMHVTAVKNLVGCKNLFQCTKKKVSPVVHSSSPGIIDSPVMRESLTPLTPVTNASIGDIQVITVCI